MITNTKVNVMCDLETLGVRPGCKILSLAAVPFLVTSNITPFYMKIDRNSYPNDFHDDYSTLVWWDKQDQAARDEAFSGKMSVGEVLDEFKIWCMRIPGDVVLWGNGSDFDNAILNEAYRLMGTPAPWNFRNNMCYRTLKNLFPQVPYTKPTQAHNALSDATAQAIHATAILRSRFIGLQHG